MPLYEYKCDACGKRFEIIQKFSDDPPDACRICGKGPVHRQQSSPAFQFKGSGWYVTDYAKSSGSTDKSSESGSPTDSKPADSSSKTDSTTSKADVPAAASASSSPSKE